jgi:MFS family permease
VPRGRLGLAPPGEAAVALLLLAAAVFALGETLFAPVWSTLVNELAPDHLRGRYNALSACGWDVTGIIGPPWAPR